MKKTINIFVAGAKDLKNERNALKALAHELNTSYEDRKININLKIRSYEDFGDNQKEYNNFIENSADVAIFVLKDRIGKHTEEEFINAASAYNRKKIPEIIVFLNKDRKETPEIDHIQELLQEHLSNHYFVEYSDDDDLKVKARKRLDRLIRPTFRMNNRVTMWAFALTTLCAVVFAGLFVWSYFLKDDASERDTPALTSESQSILFAGGGTVNNFIRKKYGINLESYPNAIYASMPSGTAAPLIAEEFNRHTKLNENKKEMLRFVSVILTADKSQKDKMLKSCQEEVFYNDACIVECYLGEDPMSIYISKKYLINNRIGNNGIIKPRELERIISDNTSKDIIYFYVTSETSGTRERFNHSIISDPKIKDIKELNDNVSIYNETDPNKYFMEPYIIMGSKYYYPLKLAERDYTTFAFYDEKNNPISKPIYLYFVAFKDKGNNTYYTIPDRIYDFLMSIDITKKAILNNEDYKNHRINAKGLIEQLTKREDYIKQ